MKIRHEELAINAEDPFGTCRLGREKYAEVLTTIVSTYADGFVLAINNDWGTGKTTFLKMWQQLLRNRDFTTVYFNAWENDFNTDPMVAIMAELNAIADSSTRKAFRSAMEKGAALTKNVLPGAIKAFTKRYVDIQEIVDAVEKASKASAEILQEEINDYTKRKKSIRDFRAKLEKFVEKTNGEEPIVFMIDELDRCRPDYAVEVLEQLKHLFSVPGIVFVLAIDKPHLAASVRGVYGSEHINTDEYLRRFIDLEYSIPEPSVETFCKYLYDYYEFENFFASAERSKYGSLAGESSSLLKIAQLLMTAPTATLRQMERIFARTRLILSAFLAKEYTFANALFVLAYLAELKPEVYRKLKYGKMRVQELADTIFQLMPVSGQRDDFIIMQATARLLSLLENQMNLNRKGSVLLREVDAGSFVTDITVINGEGDSQDVLARAIGAVYNNYDASHARLDFLTTKIDLTTPLEFD